MLGVALNLRQLSVGSIVLQNKPSRVSSLLSALEKILQDEKVEPGAAASIHGQLNFAQGQYLGSPLKPAMQFFSKIASQGWSEALRPELAVACLFAKSVFENERPRAFDIHEHTVPVLVFTDGAWEPSADQPAGAGVVVLDLLTGTRAAHEVEVPEKLVQHWQQLGKAQIIAELELLPIVVFFEAYVELCRGRRVLLFVDNNAVRDAVAKSSSRSLTLLILLSELHRLWRLWASSQSLCWVSRVPTKSNIGDLPSRQLPGEAAHIIGGEHRPNLVPSAALQKMICNAASFVDHMRNFLARTQKEQSFEKNG